MKPAMPSRRGEITRYVIVILATLLGFGGSANAVDTVGSVAGAVACFVGSLLAATGALIAMRWRRSFPAVITIAITLATVPFAAVWPIASWAYLSLATHRRWRATVGVGLLSIAMNTAVPALSGTTVNVSFDGPQTTAIWVWVQIASYLLFATMFTVALAGIGSYLGARRDARTAMQERLAAAERERSLVEENSRVEERNRIAREMHDVLAHKISLISMHAGALAYRDDLSREEIHEAAQTIQNSSHQALSELRLILGQLRQTDDGSSIAKPQPTLASLDELLDEHRATGRHVEIISTIDGEPAQTVSRHAYRILQEGLTNAAKHAPGTPVRVRIDGGPQTGVSIEVRNPLSVAATTPPGAQMGLIGLEERAELVGGTLSAGPDGAGEFVMKVWMPW